MTDPAGHHTTDRCDECGKWRPLVEPFDDEYLCATCRKNHLTCARDSMRLELVR
jgi:hypothetical protein